MNRLSSFLALGCLLVSPARADSTVVWPLPSVPAGVNTAATATPQVDWLRRVEFNTEMAHKQPQVDLVFDGDSITDFWMSKGRSIWNQHYANLHAFDFGIAGDKTENLLWRLQNGQVANLHPKLIVLMIGTNNLAKNTPAEIAAGVKADVDEYAKDCPDAVLLLQAVLPRDVSPTHPRRAQIQALNQLISAYADGSKVVYLDFGNKFLLPDGSLNQDLMLPDLVHPSEKGYQVWADAIQPEIDKIFPTPPQ
jgi:beta-glucosidase